MGRPLSYADNVVRWLRERLDREPSLAEPRELALALRVLALWRASVIVDAFVTRHGRKVLQGPFAGMAYVEGATEGALAPRLLGTYEAELHRSEEHTSELQSRRNLVCRLLLEKKKLVCRLMLEKTLSP